MKSEPSTNNVSPLNESGHPASPGVLAQIACCVSAQAASVQGQDAQREVGSRNTSPFKQEPEAFLPFPGESSQEVPYEPTLVRTMLEKGSLEVLTAREALIFERHMPQSAQWISAAIGMPLTVLLVSKLGGHVLSMYGTERRVLIDLLGTEAVAKLKKKMGGLTLAVPLCSAGRRAVTQFRIREEFDSLTAVGLSARKTVRHLTYRLCSR